MMFTKYVTNSSLISRVKSTETRHLSKHHASTATVCLNFFAKFAIIPSMASITSYSITNVKNINASWLRNRPKKKRRTARAGLFERGKQEEAA
ncbi:hypothetical protein Bca4012_022273 [Brassica carinata]